MSARSISVLALAACAALSCAAPAPKPPGSVASIDVEYEDNPSAPKKKDTKSAEDLAYWEDPKVKQALIQAPPPPQAAAVALPGVERWTLKNGLQVIVVARKDLPVVSFGVAIKAGGYDEDKNETLGVADFTASMLRRGTAGKKRRDADDISKAIDFVGGTLDAQAGLETTQAACSVLSKDTGLCVDLLADMLLHPAFPEKEMAEVRDEMLAGLAARYDSPYQLGSEHFENLLFGEKNPRGWVLMPEDVQKITRDKLLAFWKTYYRPGNTLLAVAGDVDPKRLRPQLEQAFGGWAKGDVPARPAFKMAALKATRVLIVDRPDLTQATILLGHRGLRHADPMWFPATLMNYVLGGSDFSSRLMTEVRSRRGLTYGISSSYGATLYDGAFLVAASTKNENVWQALVATVAQIRKIKTEGPTAAELTKAKGFYAGSYPLDLQRASGIASALVIAEVHGLDAGFVPDFALRMAAVDEAQAKEAAQTLLDPDNLLVVVVGKGDVIEPQIAPTGLRVDRVNFKDPISHAARAKLKKQPAPQ